MSFQRMIEIASSLDAKSSAIDFAVQPVALVLELAQLDQLALRVLEALELPTASCSFVAARSITSACWRARVADLGHAVAEDVSGGLVDVVADVVERAASRYMSSRSNGVTNVRLSRSTTSCVRRSPSCSASLMSRASVSRSFGKPSSSRTSSRAIATLFSAARLYRS